MLRFLVFIHIQITEYGLIHVDKVACTLSDQIKAASFVFSAKVRFVTGWLDALRLYFTRVSHT